MELWAYIASAMLISMGARGTRITESSIGMRPPGGIGALVYQLLVLIVNISCLVIPIWGFFAFSWWIPIVVFVGWALVIAKVELMTASAPYIWVLCIWLTPIGAALGVWSLMEA